MNIDKWLKQKSKYWLELEGILKKVKQNKFSQLTTNDLRRLNSLYLATAQDLAFGRSIGISKNSENYLNNLVIQAHNQIYSAKTNGDLSLWQYIWYEYPKVFQRFLGYILVAFVFFCAGLSFAVYEVENKSDFVNAYTAPGNPILPESIKKLINQHKMWTDSIQGFESYSSAFIATNNIRVSILLYILGIFLGIGTVVILWLNGLSIGVVLAYGYKHGMLAKILSFIAGHGVFELMAFFIAGGAGLSLGWAIINPGQYSRLDSLRLIAYDSVKVFCGVIPLLIWAGIIEGFISPQVKISETIKFATSIFTFVIFMLYLLFPRKSSFVVNKEV